MYYVLQRLLVIVTFLVNCYVIHDLDHGQQHGLAAAIAIIFVAQVRRSSDFVFAYDLRVYGNLSRPIGAGYLPVNCCVHAGVFAAQWVLSSFLMYRVAHSMIQHEVDEHHNEYLEQLMKHFNLAYIVVGPIVVFVADWVIPPMFFWR